MIKQENHMVGEEIFIQNAGLVLLWPFFGFYFNKLRVLSDTQFIDFDASCRVVHLLEYLVNGTKKMPDQILALNKILCNIDISQYIPPEIPLTEVETDLSEELLKTAIQQWEILNNTSIEGLRTAFLQRNGKLSIDKNGWRLQVEKRGYDILLDNLPWAINMIKTSWMNKTIYVEWN